MSSCGSVGTIPKESKKHHGMNNTQTSSSAWMVAREIGPSMCEYCLDAWRTRSSQVGQSLRGTEASRPNFGTTSVTKDTIAFTMSQSCTLSGCIATRTRRDKCWAPATHIASHTMYLEGVAHPMLESAMSLRENGISFPPRRGGDQAAIWALTFFALRSHISRPFRVQRFCAWWRGSPRWRGKPIPAPQ